MSTLSKLSRVSFSYYQIPSKDDRLDQVDQRVQYQFTDKFHWKFAEKIKKLFKAQIKQNSLNIRTKASTWTSKKGARNQIILNS